MNDRRIISKIIPVLKGGSRWPKSTPVAAFRPTGTMIPTHGGRVAIRDREPSLSSWLGDHANQIRFDNSYGRFRWLLEVVCYRKL